MPKRRSLLQKSQSNDNLRKINNSIKENINPNQSTRSYSSSQAGPALQIRLERARADDYKRRLHNEHRTLQRARKTQDKLRTEATIAKDELASAKDDLAQARESNAALKKDKNTLRMRCARAPVQLNKAIQKAKTHQVKEKGIITEVDREMVRDLVQLGLPVSSISGAIHTVSRGLGVAVEGSVDERSVSRIVREGKVAAEIQIVHEIHKARSMSPSSRTLKNILY
jgi:myosin heavy subunit